MILNDNEIFVTNNNSKKELKCLFFPIFSNLYETYEQSECSVLLVKKNLVRLFRRLNKIT